MTRPSLLFTCLFSLLLYSCKDAAPDSSKADAQASVEPVSATASEIAAEDSELPVEPDQIKFTRNVDPSTVDPGKIAPAPAPEAEVVERQTKASTVQEARDRAKAKPSAADKKPVMGDATNVKASPKVKDGVTTSSGFPEGPSTIPLSTNTAPAAAPKTAAAENEQEELASPPDHAPWNTLLQRYVNGKGDVDYGGFKKAEAALDTYLSSLRESGPKEDWGRNEIMAYWINAYNAFTIKRVLKAYPITSIQDLDGGDPWKVKWIELDGKTYSLNNIEHDILRPKYGDARIHFAVNCAAASCPPLPNKAFTGDNLNRMLESNARAFIRNTEYNETSGPVRVSKIFDWYGEDFGNLRDYLNKYLATAIPAGSDIGFKEYDWGLNEQ